jgi:cathepsin L
MAPISTSSHLICGALLVIVLATATVDTSAAAREGASRPQRGALLSSVAVQHERWMAKFGRAYTDADDKLRRREVFAANARHVDAVNRAGNRTYTLGLNQFSDLTDDEFVETHLGFRHMQLRPQEKNAPAAAADAFKAKGAALRDGQLQLQYVPGSVDWRAQGAVTEIKNQGTCGNTQRTATMARH